MALEIIWSKRAASGYAKILKYLDENWNVKQVEEYENQVSDFLKKLSDYPELLQKSDKTGYRRGPINKLTIIIYKLDEDKNQLKIIAIRDARQKQKSY